MKKFLLMASVLATSISAFADNQFFVIMKDCTAESYPTDKVDSLAFDAPSGAKILGFGDLMKAIEAVKASQDSLAGELKESKANEDALQIKIGDLSDDLKNVQASEKTLQGKVSDLSDDIKDMKANEKTLQGKIGDLSDDLKASKATSETGDKALQTKLDSLAKELQASKATNAAGEKVLLAKQDSLAKELTASKKSEAAMKTKVNMLETETDSLKNIITKYEDIVYDRYTFVDLGLPSGTLWATCNIGANSPEEYGVGFHAGDTEPYTKESKWCDVKNSELESLGVVDRNGELTAKYDAATANWGGRWRLPTQEETYELYKNCESEYTTMNGVNGVLVTGKNGASIFLPAAGWGGDYKVNEEGHYMTSKFEDSSYKTNYVYQLTFEKDGALKANTGFNRTWTFSVRAVRKTK